MTSKIKNNRPLTFVDIFAGCGGLSLGLMQSGWKGLFAIERDVHAFKTLHDNLVATKSSYQFEWPSWLPSRAHSVDDVLKKHEKNLKNLKGSVDMIVGGPPCQGFSSAGIRGVGVIDVHHKKPLHMIEEGNKTKVTDLALLCSNCHRIVHSSKRWLSIKEVRDALLIR